MDVKAFVKLLNADFYTGVPDSQLKALCNFLIDTYGVEEKHHIIAANEGNCTAIAAGYHLATGKYPVVYMQNSGEGNIINPVASLLNDKVYAIPCIFVVGWRGEPGIKDEPQHIYQGQVTIDLLEMMDIRTYIVDCETTKEELKVKMKEFEKLLTHGKSVAFVMKKNALVYEGSTKYSNHYMMKREEIIKHITDVTKDDIVISTTGKASRELFETRESKQEDHRYDFLTVGSMGHSSSIAYGVAIHKPDRKVWCIDGDGAALMHMGSMAVIGTTSPANLIHIVINNGAHETVGGQPTVAKGINFVQIAKGCGYPNVVCVETFEELDRELVIAKKKKELCFIEVKCAIGSRGDLGRPTTTAKENKESFMKYLNSVNK